MVDTKKLLITIIHRHLPHAKILLFGSRARGKFHEGADYDIALDAGTRIPRETMLNIASDIDESAVPVFVDIIDVNAVSTEFLAEIKKEFVEWI